MSVTSRWEWTTIDRRKDTVATDPSFIFRINWSLTRQRISDAPYVSQLGESLNALTGYNGGIDETITAPTVRQITGNTTNYYGQIIRPTGTFFGGKPLYSSDIFTASGVDKKAWLYYEADVPQTRVFSANAEDSPPYDGTTGQSWSDTIAGWAIPTTDGYFTETVESLSFLCIADTQTYQDKKVGWYTQKQKWVARSRNTRDEL